MKKKLSLAAYKALQGINSQEQGCELKAAEQFLLDWGRQEGSITHFDMNPNYQKWCERFYPELNNERKLKSRFSYLANKLESLAISTSLIESVLAQAQESNYTDQQLNKLSGIYLYQNKRSLLQMVFTFLGGLVANWYGNEGSK